MLGLAFLMLVGCVFYFFKFLFLAFRHHRNKARLFEAGFFLVFGYILFSLIKISIEMGA